MPSAIVAAPVANKVLNGGIVWVAVSYMRGLANLGYDVHLVEQIATEACVDATGSPTDFRSSVNLEFFRRAVQAAGISTHATLLCDGARESEGLSPPEVAEVAARADLLLNISGHLELESLSTVAGRRLYLDLDPGFTQIWHEDGTLAIPPHDVYFTIGENIGRANCPIPTNGLEWRPTRPPVVLDDWSVVPGGDHERFTTVAAWRGPYGRLEGAGRVYGLKLDEFRKVIELPERAPQTFELALDIHPAEKSDLEALQTHGWRLVDPRSVAGDPDLFRSYVQGSAAEFSVAQGIYVETNSGWFSDRTTRYLASGKPALVQDTGFSETIPTDEGLLAFGTLEEAVAGAEAIAADYDRHARAAREIAVQYFDSDTVIAKLLEDAFA